MIFEYETQDVIREKNQEIKQLKAIIDALIFQIDDLKGALEMERFWNICDEQTLADAAEEREEQARLAKAKPKATKAKMKAKK